VSEQAQLETRLQEGTYRDPKAARVKFGEVAENWLNNRRDLKPSTWWKYRGLLDRHILPT
jgi:hypothetical protein